MCSGFCDVFGYVCFGVFWYWLDLVGVGIVGIGVVDIGYFGLLVCGGDQCVQLYLFFGVLCFGCMWGQCVDMFV